jgi:hypothetical protein
MLQNIGVNQVVNQNDACMLQRFDRFERQEIGVARPCANQRDKYRG